MGPYQVVSFKLRVKLVLISCLVRCLYTCLNTQVLKAYLRQWSLFMGIPHSFLALSRYWILPIYIWTLVKWSIFQFRYKFLTRSQILELSLHVNTKINKVHSISHTRNIFEILIIGKLLLLIQEISLWLLISGLDLKLQPEKPANVYYSLRGSAFVLNCTVAVGNVQALNVTWKHNGKWLGHEVEQVDSSTVQLKLSNTSRINNGFYWCGPKLDNRLRGINISLTVAGNRIHSFISKYELINFAWTQGCGLKIIMRNAEVLNHENPGALQCRTWPWQ